jgi:hypothetical protein
MGLKISRGIETTPAKVVLYGVEGIGKTTLASQFPGALILDTENGSRRLNVARVRCSSWPDLMVALREMVVDPAGFQTVVVDSADWAESLCRQWLCEKHGKKSIEDWPYGKGFTVLAETFDKLLKVCDQIVEAGLHVVIVAHSKVVRTSPPDQTEGFDRYELDLHKHLAPSIKEWADCVLFLNYRTKLVQGSDGRHKGLGGKQRLMFAERTAAWDAKNRYGLPEEMPMGIEALAPIFATAAESGPPSSRSEGVAGVSLDTIRATIAKAGTVAKLGKITDRIDQLLSEDQITGDDWSSLTDLVNARHAEIEPEHQAAAGEEVAHGA